MFHTIRYALACISLYLATATADISIFSDVNAFETLTNSSHGFPCQKFRSSPILAPVLQVNKWDKENTDSAPYIFLGTVYDNKAGPMILDSRDLSLVYADQRFENAYSSSVHEVNGQRYLTFWEGAHSRGHANGYCLVFDENYELKYKVTAQGLNGALADMHEMNFTPEGNIIFSTYFNIDYDCSSVGGPEKSLLMDSGFQEVNPETNEVVFSWAASEHFAINDSYARYTPGFGVSRDSGYDFFHLNSVEKTSDGNYLVSSRHLSLLTLINGKTGLPIWILGGRHNQFQDLSSGAATNFGWQHNARFHHNQTHITLFDNHGEYTGRCKTGDDGKRKCNTRGLHLEIDVDKMTARVVREYFHPEDIDTGAMGGFQSLGSGNVMVAWGYNPGFVEYTENGTVVMDVQRGNIGHKYVLDMFAYRVSKHDWVGKPKWPPSMAVDTVDGTTKNGTVYLSWNGATEVASWAVFTSNQTTTINNPQNHLTTTNRTGFETAVFLATAPSHRYIAAAAVSSSGTVLGSTYVIDMVTGQPVSTPSNITSLSAPKAVSVTTASGVVGGGVFFVAVLFYAVNYYWGRKAEEKGEATYEKVEGEDLALEEGA